MIYLPNNLEKFDFVNYELGFYLSTQYKIHNAIQQTIINKNKALD